MLVRDYLEIRSKLDRQDGGEILKAFFKVVLGKSDTDKRTVGDYMHKHTWQVTRDKLQEISPKVY